MYLLKKIGVGLLKDEFAIAEIGFFSLYTIKYAYWNIYLSFVNLFPHIYTIKILNLKFRGAFRHAHTPSLT